MEILQCRFNGNNACGCKKNVNGKCLCPKRCQHLPATKMKNLCERYKERECPFWNFNTATMMPMANPLTEKDFEQHLNLI